MRRVRRKKRRRVQAGKTKICSRVEPHTLVVCLSSQLRGRAAAVPAYYTEVFPAYCTVAR